MADYNTEFVEYIRAIGRGKRAGKSLTQAQAFRAMSLILDGQVSPEQKGAFLMLLRLREETADELAGFVQASRHATGPQFRQLNADLDLGCYAGKRRHLPWFLLAVLLLVQHGKRVFLHGTQEPCSQRLYLSQVFSELGLPVAQTAEQAAYYLTDSGFCYTQLAAINPALDGLIQLRSQLGLRSCANSLARMLNPSQSACSYQGVFHRHIDQRHATVANMLRDANVLCLRGEGGETELNPERPVDLHLSRSGESEVIAVAPLTEQWSYKAPVLAPGQLVEVWRGEQNNPYANHAVTGTLASMLVLTEQLDWQQALSTAREWWQERDTSFPWCARTEHLNSAVGF